MYQRENTGVWQGWHRASAHLNPPLQHQPSIQHTKHHGERVYSSIIRYGQAPAYPTYHTFREHPQGFQVLHDVAALVGYQQQEQVLDRLVDVTDRLCLDERVLLVAWDIVRVWNV